MGALSQLGGRLREDLAAWQRLDFAEIVFDQRDRAAIALAVLIGLSLAVLLWRGALRRGRRTGIALPALLSAADASTGIRHVPLLLVLAGLAIFMLALAEPHGALSAQQVSYSGRRIAILIDGSSSMTASFDTVRLRRAAAPNNLFTTTVGAAETFIRQRMNGRYRDVIALIEFGNQAYVITPFTTDYANVLLSASLIGQWDEYQRFPDFGTTIGTALQQAINLFEAFNYLDAAGNAMVIFSDGQDTDVSLGGRSVRQVMARAAAAQIPVYFIRCGFNRQLGDVIPDALWKPAVEFTGGRFYAAANEQDVLNAIGDIDRRSGGTIEITQYSVRQPQFAPFALAAAALWLLALLMKCTGSYFNTFP